MVNFYKEVIKLTLSKIEHLTKEDIIKNGSIFTPNYIVEIAKKWLKDKVSRNDFLIDFGVGYGAFISKFIENTSNLIATDIDEDSINLVKQLFPEIHVVLENSLMNISRHKYGINELDKLFIIGNPPYNDLTSQYKKGEKGSIEMDEKVISRDLGISFMKMYSLLKPEYICILHPLSYLIKKTNFNSLKDFKNDYQLEKALIFSSNEFESIKKSNAEFPVCLALYKRHVGFEMDFEYIQKFKFSILNSDEIFILEDFKQIDGWVDKYPKKDGKKPTDLQFYTIRDINALKRNRSFLVGDIANGIKVDLESLYKYAWLDYFKNNFQPKNSYLFGNLSPLYSIEVEDLEVKKELISYIYMNNKVVKEYIDSNNLIPLLFHYYSLKDFTVNYPLLEKIITQIVSR